MQASQIDARKSAETIYQLITHKKNSEIERLYSINALANHYFSDIFECIDTHTIKNAQKLNSLYFDPFITEGGWNYVCMTKFLRENLIELSNSVKVNFHTGKLDQDAAFILQTLNETNILIQKLIILSKFQAIIESQNELRQVIENITTNKEYHYILLEQVIKEQENADALFDKTIIKFTDSALTWLPLFLKENKALEIASKWHQDISAEYFENTLFDKALDDKAREIHRNILSIAQYLKTSPKYISLIFGNK